MEKERPNKRPKPSNDGPGKKGPSASSEFAKRGVDMSQSDPKARGIFSIFPSLGARGRGRGRGR
jgi:hypothetical protein